MIPISVAKSLHIVGFPDHDPEVVQILRFGQVLHPETSTGTNMFIVKNNKLKIHKNTSQVKIDYERFLFFVN